MAKRFPVNRERVIELGKYDEAFGAESARGKVILSTARLDDLLRLLISTTLVGDEAFIQELFDNQYAPFQSLGAKISVAFGLGLISATEYHNLKVVKAIRNAFAHHLHDVSFDSKWVAERCKEFIFPENLLPDPNDSNSQRFQWMVYQLDLELQFRIEKAPRPRDTICEVEWELSGGNYATIKGCRALV